MQLLSLVKSLRDTGHFTAVSVTRPFEFEGQRKVEAADRMIAALEGAAHLVVVVEQVRTLYLCCSCYDNNSQVFQPMLGTYWLCPNLCCSCYAFVLYDLCAWHCSCCKVQKNRLKTSYNGRVHELGAVQQA